MAHPRSLIAPLSRLTIRSIAPPRPKILSFAPAPQIIWRGNAQKSVKPKNEKKKKRRPDFRQYDLRKAHTFSLIDAMHYIRAFEVGQNPVSRKYEVHIRLRSLKDGPIIRNRIRLPFPVKTDTRTCVIAVPGSKAAEDAIAAGAILVGEEEVFEIIKNGKIEFERCLCHVDSLQKLNKANLGRILGPKGLMPSPKTKTVVSDVKKTLQSMAGAAEYKERTAVVHMAIGQLGFTPEQLRTNVTAFIEAVKKDMTDLSDKINKEIHEIVLSSTGSPGFTLSGEFRSGESIEPKALAGPL